MNIENLIFCLAYEQLLKVLSNYEAKPLLGSLPINVYTKDEQSLESPSNMEEEEDESSKKFLKTFPEEGNFTNFLLFIYDKYAYICIHMLFLFVKEGIACTKLETNSFHQSHHMHTSR